MKKILILGGSENQLPLIKSAKELGYQVILCDYSDNAIGKKYADIFYCVSTLDKEAVLKVAEKEKIDGITTNSEPAMPVVAYVGNELGLPSNPYESIITLSRKDLFRNFLRDNGFNCPQVYTTDNIRDALDNIYRFKFPLIVKPIDSSGSRGVKRINSVNEFKNGFETAKSFSKSNQVIIEEFIERSHDYMIGGDIFVLNGKVIFWGLMNSMRDITVNEFVPVGTSFPTFVNYEQLKTIKNAINKIIELLKIEFGPFNLELMFNKDNQLYIIEMNPRNGGNKIPEILKIATGVDLMRLTVEASLGIKDIKLTNYFEEKYVSTYVLHTDKDGILKNIYYSDEIRNNIIDIKMNKKIGDNVEKFDNADKLIGIVFMQFNSLVEMNYKLNNINKLIKIEVD